MTKVFTSCSRHTGLLTFMSNTCNCSCADIFALFQSPMSAPTSLPLHRLFPLPGTLPCQIFVWLFSGSTVHLCHSVASWERPLLATQFTKSTCLQSPTHLPLFLREPVYCKFLKRGEILFYLLTTSQNYNYLRILKTARTNLIYRMNIESIAGWAMKL